ncbi:MAG: hypothetical protein ACREQE_05975 [Candidatus Binataceae bacterium]
MRCGCCTADKAPEDFYRRRWSGRPDGHQNYCKRCMNALVRVRDAATRRRLYQSLRVGKEPEPVAPEATATAAFMVLIDETRGCYVVRPGQILAGAHGDLFPVALSDGRQWVNRMRLFADCEAAAAACANWNRTAGLTE